MLTPLFESSIGRVRKIPTTFRLHKHSSQKALLTLSTSCWPTYTAQIMVTCSGVFFSHILIDLYDLHEASIVIRVRAIRCIIYSSVLQPPRVYILSIFGHTR